MLKGCSHASGQIASRNHHGDCLQPPESGLSDFKLLKNNAACYEDHVSQAERTKLHHLSWDAFGAFPAFPKLFSKPTNKAKGKNAKNPASWHSAESRALAKYTSRSRPFGPANQSKYATRFGCLKVRLRTQTSRTEAPDLRHLSSKGPAETNQFHRSRITAASSVTCPLEPHTPVTVGLVPTEKKVKDCKVENSQLLRCRACSVT